MRLTATLRVSYAATVTITVKSEHGTSVPLLRGSLDRMEYVGVRPAWWAWSVPR